LPAASTASFKPPPGERDVLSRYSAAEPAVLLDFHREAGRCRNAMPNQ
jgi:hypothetical protein